MKIFNDYKVEVILEALRENFFGSLFYISRGGNLKRKESMKKGILFDYDGTLIDSVLLIREALKSMTTRYNREIPSEETLKVLIGMTLKEQMKWLLGDDFEAGYREFNKWYTDKHDEYIQSFDGVKPVVMALHKQGFHLGIVSNNGHVNIQRGLEWLGLKEVFEFVVTVEDVKIGKPDPEGIFLAMEVMSLDKANTIYVGDTTCDVISAYKAGLTSVRVNWTDRPRHTEKGIEADFYVRTPKELLKRVEDFFSLL